VRGRKGRARFAAWLLAAARIPLLVSCLLGSGTARASSEGALTVDPVQAPHTQPWRVTSFIEDGKLEGRGLFFIDFEKDGTAWIAASDGLYRFDGYRWDHYTSAHGLPSDYVRAVRVTRDGKLWVGTDRGAGIFNGKSFDPAGTEGHLAGPSVRRIVEDPDGTLWFCCDQWPPSDVPAGLTRYRDGKWKSWRAADGLPSDYVSDILRDSAGRHLVLTRKGLAEFDGERFSLPLEGTGLRNSRAYMWSAVETPDGRVVMTSDDWVFVREGGRWRQAANGPEQIMLGQIVLTRDGAILACSSRRMADFVEWKHDRFVPIWHVDLDTRGDVQFIGEAPDGSIWVAGFNTLARWERLGGEWQTYERFPRPMLRDVEGGIWFAGEGRILRLHDDRWIGISDTASLLVTDHSEGVWMIGRTGATRWHRDGLARFSRETLGVETPQIASVDGAGDVWVTGKNSDGQQPISSFDGKEWTRIEETGIEATETVVTWSSDRDGGMWYVVEDRRAESYRLIQVTGEGVTKVPLPADTHRYWEPYVKMDQEGRLWLFGFFGLYVSEPGAGRPDWRKVDGLPGTRVTSVAVRGREVWFCFQGTTGGRSGVSRLLDGEWEHFRNVSRNVIAGRFDQALFFTHPRGVYVREPESREPMWFLTFPEPTRVLSLLAGANRDLWLGSTGRVFHFSPDGVPPETEILGGEKDVFHEEDLILRVRGIERFRPLNRSREFSVAVQIDDRRWSDFEPLEDETVTIGDLTTGDHMVRIRVRDQGLDIDPTPAEWSFRFHPVPLQERPWFQPLAIGVFVALLLLAILSIVARQRERAQRRRKHELEHEILQISEREQRRIGQDLHDGLGQRLTSISFQCEALRGILEKGEPSSCDRLREIGAAVRTAISETRGLAHALYPAEIDQGNLEIALDDLVASVDRAFGGTCTYRHDWSPAPLDRDDALNVYRLVQEALGNAIRHSSAEALHVASRREGRTWVVEVRDDGRGFDPAEVAGAGLGLQIMRYRAHLVGGTLSVESSPGAGTTVRCSLRVQVESPDPRS